MLNLTRTKAQKQGDLYVTFIKFYNNKRDKYYKCKIEGFVKKKLGISLQKGLKWELMYLYFFL